MISENQIPKEYKDIIESQLDRFKQKIHTEEIDRIPVVDNIPSEYSEKWLKIKNVICVFVDMKNSTKFSASHHASTTGRVYSLFTGTAVRIFRAFGSPYIDIKGDGVFALFDYDKVHTALASAVTFKTFIKEEFERKVTNKTKIDTGVHIGIDQATLLVSKIGLRRSSKRGDMHNEVWAGKAVNMAAKLSSLSKNDEIYVSDRYFSKIRSEKALYSCGCDGFGFFRNNSFLWKEKDLSYDDRFSFDTAHFLESNWCQVHGAEYLKELIKSDHA